ncbi:Rv2578c family radical SAM protein [soil metagenome]
MRWQNLKSENNGSGSRLPGLEEPSTVRTFDSPEALDVRFHEVHARSAINAVPERSRMPFRFTINPYRGCTHGCTYCFARPTHTYLGFNADRDFDREIVVKVNAPELVRAELGRSSWAGGHVALGTNTDPYQWVESKYRLMPGIWEAMRDFSNPCSVLSKSPLLLRDVKLFKEISERTEFVANLSIPTLDEKAWRASEPHTPHPRTRIAALAELNRVGISTGVLIAPLMPGINDDPAEVEKILELVGEAGAGSVGGIGLHLRSETRGVFMDWLRQYRPDLVSTYERLYSNGAYLPKAQRERLARLASGGRRPRRFEAEPRPVVRGGGRGSGGARAARGTGGNRQKGGSIDVPRGRRANSSARPVLPAEPQTRRQARLF